MYLSLYIYIYIERERARKECIIIYGYHGAKDFFHFSLRLSVPNAITVKQNFHRFFAPFNLSVAMCSPLSFPM